MTLLSIFGVGPQPSVVTDGDSRVLSDSPLRADRDHNVGLRSVVGLETAPFRVDIQDPYTREATMRALSGASEWLAADRCQLVFSEFRDDRGVPLVIKLNELKTTPQGYLRLVMFRDGESHRTCAREGILAFTARLSRVVYLCGRKFERASRRDVREVQATIIHEMLHSLGLGENPPSPRHISFRVARLCWS